MSTPTRYFCYHVRHYGLAALPPRVTIAELARALNVARLTIHRLIRAGRLPAPPAGGWTKLDVLHAIQRASDAFNSPKDTLHALAWCFRSDGFSTETDYGRFFVEDDLMGEYPRTFLSRIIA